MPEEEKRNMIWKDDPRAIPEEEECSDGLVPQNIAKETITISVAEGFTTMPKVFFDHFRLTLYSKLNALLKTGMLQKIVGFPVTNRVINRQACEFTGYDFWRIGLDTFRTEISVTLTLDSPQGKRTWEGYMQLYCWFDEDGLRCTYEDMRSIHFRPDHQDDIRLSPFLVPYLTGGQIDAICEEIWKQSFPEALTNPDKGNAEKLAAAYGLQVQYLPVCGCDESTSMMFFTAGKLRVYTEREEIPGFIEAKVEETYIPANTIVVNLFKTKTDYAAFNILHECCHYIFHYLAFRLQKMISSDMRNIRMKEVKIDPKSRITDPIYWMEKQANRGAYGLLMPKSWIQKEIEKELPGAKHTRHAGEKYDIIGTQICIKYKFANYQMRAPMIQLGIIEAKGALNWLPGRIKVAPFAFNVNSCRKTEETFLINRVEAGDLYEKSEAFRKLIDEKRFVVTNAHVVRNDPRFVQETDKGPELTPWANAHTDQCCLRFERIYIQRGPGVYVFGRMNLDEEYVSRSMFFLEKNQVVLNEMEAEEQYKNAFPESFREGLMMLMAQSKTSIEKMAEMLVISDSTFKRWIKNEENITVDFVMSVSLILKLPDWLSNLLLDRAGLCLGEKNKRHMALRWIQRAMWMDGIGKANEYLMKRGFEPLHIG